MLSPLAENLLPWYEQHGRRLPWRQHPDPYAVWVSEIMLQQTRVETVIPYFQHWMERFPSLEGLAASSQQDVLAAWEGLGYYSRARNLHRSAQIICNHHNGCIPRDAASLRKLPGIGEYTAGAIASLAFGQDEAALDGNIRRVLARVFDVQEPERSPEGERRLWGLARQHLPTGRSADFNQGLMDLGASICAPRAPRCDDCPLKSICQAYHLGIQEARPVRTRRPRPPHVTVTAAIIHRNNQVLIAQRPGDGLLGGLWEFPGGKVETGETLDACLRREIQEELGAAVWVGSEAGAYRHAYTHFHVTLHAFHCILPAGSEPQNLQHTALQWVGVAELEDYPMGKIDRQIARRLVEDNDHH